MPNPVFLKAGWRKLLMVNYAIDPALLEPYIPPHTQLDLFNNTCYVSLVGFLFKDTRVRGFKIPFHINFEEVNLRFYVKHIRPDGEVRRGVCFIKEIVPRRAITFVANTLYKEKYQTLPMKHNIHAEDGGIRVRYQWLHQKKWNTLACTAHGHLQTIAPGSPEEFITEHYWGYTALSYLQSSEYAVEHPRWEVYDVKHHEVDVDFGSLYGKAFASLATQEAASVFLAEGSEIVVRKGNVI